MTASEHEHGEAFVHMAYTSSDGSERLVIWNSRDGVTPLACTSPITGAELLHRGPWAAEVRDPSHVPAVGDWVWVDQDSEDAFKKALEFVERWWNDPKVPMREHPTFNPDGLDTEEAKRKAAFTYAKAVSGPGEPALVQVTEPLREQFRFGATPNRSGKRGNGPRSA